MPGPQHVSGGHGNDGTPVLDKTKIVENKTSPEISNSTLPAPTGNRHTDQQNASALARQSFPTAKDMTYLTDGKALTGKEHTAPNGTPILETPSGQKYRGTLNDNGNISQWQPVDDKGKDVGKPIQVTSERTGAPPSGMRPEQYVVAPKAESAKAPEPKLESKPEPTRIEQPKSDKPIEYSKAEPKNSIDAQKELYESHKQNFDAQKQYLERAAQSLANPIGAQEKLEPKTTKVEHISATPKEPEFQRASNPYNIIATKLERTITSAPNTVEYGREFVNNFRDSRHLLKPSLEGTIQKPVETFKPEGLQIKPEPLSGLRIHQDLRTHFVSPLQGLSEPFTFKPLKPITRGDIIDQIGDIGKSKIPSVAALAAILLAGRKLDSKEPASSKAIEGVVKPRLEPKLQAILPKMDQPQKDKLAEIATKVKEGKGENLPTADDHIAKRIKQLEPKQIDSLIAWAQNKSPIKFDILPAEFQTKLSSILEHVVKATAAIKTEKAPSAQDQTKLSQDNKTMPVDKTVPLGEKTVASVKTVKPENAVKPEPAPLEETKTVQVTRQVKGGENEAESDKTVKTAESNELPESEDETKPVREKPRKTGTLYGLEGPPKRDRRTKPIQEKDITPNLERKPHPHSTLLTDTVRRLESGSLDDQYQIILQTLVQGEWKNVLECAVKDDEALYIQHYSHKAPFKHSMTSLPKISQIIQNNFFKNWAARIQDYFGDT